MICPRCNTQLQISNDHDVEIDHCPQCRGIWLDRGELEKIIQRSSDYSFRHDSHDDDHHSPHYNSHHEHDHHSGRKRSFLSDLFDF